MKPEEKLILLAELTQEDCKCQLNHKQDPRGVPQAVNYLCVPVGYNESKDVSVSVRDLTIPVCQECIDAITGNDWVLIYCLDCADSQWIHKDHAKLNYHNNNTGHDHHIIFVSNCPHCIEGDHSKVNVYFE